MKQWLHGVLKIPMYIVGLLLFIPYVILIKVPYLLGGGTYEVKGFEDYLFPFISKKD